MTLLILVISCSSQPPQMVSTTPLDAVYISSGLEKFFLGDLPFWANFSTEGACQRKTNIRFLHFANLKKSYNLNYSQVVHLQHMFNRKLYAYKSSASQAELGMKDESYIFYNVYQQVLGGSYDFTPPRFNKVSVVWVDAFLSNAKKIKKIVNKPMVQTGHPVLLSHCLTSYELEELAKKLNLDELGVKFLTADMLSIYDEKFDKHFSFTINLDELLPNKNVTLFGLQKSKDIKGNYQFMQVD